MKIKASKKIIMAALALLMAVGLAAGSTFAWFSMNDKVTVSGMAVTTQVSSNLLVAASNAGTTSVGENQFGTFTSQSVSGILEPVSTVDGTNFFYTTSGKADGDAQNDDYVAYDQAAFRTAYDVDEAVGYVDYVIELKAVNTDTSNSKYVTLKKLDLVYTGSQTDTQKAYRVAMFVQDQTGLDANGVVTGYAAQGASATCIIDITGAENQTADYAVSAAATAPSAISIMATKALTSMEVPEGQTKYFKVTLRMYLEGEDKTCTNATFLPLVDTWNLETQFKLESNNNSSLTEMSKYTAQNVNLNAVNTLVYYDGTDLYKAADMTQINTPNSTKIATAKITADELTALNTAFSSSFTRAD